MIQKKIKLKKKIIVFRERWNYETKLKCLNEYFKRFIKQMIYKKKRNLKNIFSGIFSGWLEK